MKIHGSPDASDAASVREYASKLADPALKQELVENTERSVARGTFGSPTFYVGDEIYFGKDRLRDVEEAIDAKK